MTTCGACGTEPREGARFCDACGAPAGSAASTAEYKQVTVLFADVVGSMELATELGPERLREIMTELFNSSTGIVRHYGGTVDKFTGDGLMAVFGAPIALEDHAVRACRAALNIQREAAHLAQDVAQRDGETFAVRVGLNSGQVIAGEIGSGPTAYTAVGEQVGMAQRMESAAPPGGVMVSESTAQLVGDLVKLSDPEPVRIKGREDPVLARRLLAVTLQSGVSGRSELSLVGRRWEIPAVEGILQGAIDGHGGVVGVVGPAGMGKSRFVREIASIAITKGVEVISAYCESHAREVPFHVVGRLLRAATGVDKADDETARTRLQVLVPDADPQDMLLFYDLLGVANPDVAMPSIDPDARRRRLTALVNAVLQARATPAVYVIEDAHWIDDVSESMLADFMVVIPQTPSLVMVTYRPEYRGALSRVAGSQTIALAPLSRPDSAALIAEHLGTDPSVAVLAGTIAERAAGNPFFAQELVRNLAEQGALRGGRGSYVRNVEYTDVTIPPTLHATIAARIDRLDPAGKRTLNAAAVIGSRFGTELLVALGIDDVVDELVAAELIDQVKFTQPSEYVFHHPLIRAVAYESQLKADRAELHRRLASSIAERNPEEADENAALIAEHLESAGESHAAYVWHMRAGAWSTNRDIIAARTSWHRAREVADALPSDDPDRRGMRIAPRTLLCATAYRTATNVSHSGFDELRELCAAAGDNRSLAIAMLGQITECMLHGRAPEAVRLVSEQTVLLETIGDPDLTVGLAFGAMVVYQETGQMTELLHWTQRAIDLADGDVTKGGFVLGSPLSLSILFRGLARFWLGIPGWRADFDDALAMARNADAHTFASAVVYKYGSAIVNRVLLPDATAVRDLEEALVIAVNTGDHTTLALTRYITAGALIESGTDRDRGLRYLAETRDLCLSGQFFATELPIVEIYLARERVRQGDADDAIPIMRASVDTIFANGQFGFSVMCTSILVETLLDRAADGDLAEAEEATARLANATIQDLVVCDVTLLRLRALLARARGDDTAYRQFSDRYQARVTNLGFEGHMALAESMAAGHPSNTAIAALCPPIPDTAPPL
ncbi:adenylate/guanylate cyclase domain-containing protein [Mycobacterium sp. AZCC_0083]|uniref:ATP-binding protein n=1 Tax=Mycobacterium sp. AZCC_0083 TaxID=2735882 RepID=UPI001621F899|nr:adenylate/guanylate cyclase domain-containing protein [Mycobacterium sp. AZCC_0083]MBB5162401.1 class 3 adenylate cyclase [Mycobacterium sp. AZCC_0083]